MELKFKAGDSVNIPENCTAKIENGIVIFEPDEYIPRVGDCVKLELNDKTILFYCTSSGRGYVNSKTYIFNNKVEVDCEEDGVAYCGWPNMSGYRYSKIDKEYLQSEFQKLGYEYDFETHTAKKIRWKPEVGEKYWVVGASGDVCATTWNNDSCDKKLYDVNNCHKTKSEAESHREWNKSFKFEK